MSFAQKKILHTCKIKFNIYLIYKLSFITLYLPGSVFKENVWKIVLKFKFFFVYYIL